MDFLKNHHHRHHSSATSHRSISDTDSKSTTSTRLSAPLPLSAPTTSLPPPPLPKPSSPTTLRSDLLSPTTKNLLLTPPSMSPSRQILPRRGDRRAGGADKETAGGGGGGGGGGGDGVGRRARVPVTSRNEVTIERAILGFRVCEMILSLIAFSVMASDKTQGWSGDSFDRYKEYSRRSSHLDPTSTWDIISSFDLVLVAVNAIAFAYAAFQAIALTFHLIYERHIFSYSLRSHFDFIIDQASSITNRIITHCNTLQPANSFFLKHQYMMLKKIVLQAGCIWYST
ncbi:hypothetical protein OSB04_004221 [Centaurea solstitialis]|uniref:CASP-like protein n=1 Tax=Centaurea solstitialis TaxID=347529 RepID=A0AA38U833_9ASTR|nr:hypothetical protein OSB04_004221 [Centaurea solstitialis]